MTKLKSLIGFNNPEKTKIGMQYSMFYDATKVKKQIKSTVKKDKDVDSFMHIMSGDRIHSFLIYEQAIYYAIKYDNYNHLEYFIERAFNEGIALDINLYNYAIEKNNEWTINFMKEYVDLEESN